MRIALFLSVAVVLLAGLFVIFKPKQETSSTPKQEQLGVSIAPSVTTIPERTFSLTIKNNAVIAPEKTLTVTEGEKVVVTITADTDEELHIHGYDLEVPLQKNIPKQITFTATLTGSFPIELHHAEAEIALLQVQPK